MAGERKSPLGCKTSASGLICRSRSATWRLSTAVSLASRREREDLSAEVGLGIDGVALRDVMGRSPTSSSVLERTTAAVTTRRMTRSHAMESRQQGCCRRPYVAAVEIGIIFQAPYAYELGSEAIRKAKA